MKRTLKTLALALMVVGVSATSQADISGAAHDFSGEGWSGAQICNPCHTPHNAETSVANAPLWNHDLTSVQNYTLYSSATLDSTPGQPDGISKLCLSCHDGTIAVDSFGNDSGSSFIGGSEKVGTDLRANHPVSITFDSALASSDNGLNDPDSTPSGVGGTISHDLLFAGRLECASCHDVHNSSSNENLLRITEGGSSLCLTCHNK